jgi:hypothetical protein
MASDGRSYVTGYFAMDVDGVKCGLIQKFEGGDIEGEVTTLPLAHDYYVKKHIGNVKYNDFTVQMGLSMGQPIKDWIDASLAMNYMRKSGELKAADFKREVRHIREFHDALLTEIGFPACDGAAKDAAFMNLKFSPWRVRNKKGDGSKVDNPADMAQKMWHPTDFRFVIDGLDKACTKVSKVDALTIKQTVVSDQVGMERDYFKEPGKVEFPNVKITLSEEYSHDFFAWHEQFVIEGNNTEEEHKAGSLVYLNRNRQKELLTLTLSGLGIFKISSAPRANNEDKIASVTVECYCENITSQFT